jgi:hypothetical protein
MLMLRRFRIPLLVQLSAAALTAQTPPGQAGSVTGQLRTLAGAPAIAIRVAAVAAPPVNARRADGQQYVESVAPASTVLTNNDGRYRLANIPPGRYYILAGALPDATYYPGSATEDGAMVVTIASGATTANLDFRLLKTFGGTVTGRVPPRTDPAAQEAQEKAVLSGGKLEELLEAPVATNGSFAFGHVPAGVYLLSLFPNPPGMASLVVRVGETDVAGVELAPPPTRAVTGRIVVQNGPLPRARLLFDTPQGSIGAAINGDGTFSTRLHAARHDVYLGGLPAGYSVASVRVGTEDASRGLVVGDADVSGVVITVAAPRSLPRLRGRITGLSAARIAPATVEATGPIMGTLTTALRPDGSFEFAAVTPGVYDLRLPQVPDFVPIAVVVDWNDTERQIAMPVR